MTKYTLNKIKDADILHELENASAFTVIGAGGDLNEWCIGLNEMLADEKIGQVTEFYHFKGKLMNKTYDLTGNNAYKEDITFLSFKLDGLNVSKLALFKLRFGARWLDDIVSNNNVRMNNC